GPPPAVRNARRPAAHPAAGQGGARRRPGAPVARVGLPPVPAAQAAAERGGAAVPHGGRRRGPRRARGGARRGPAPAAGRRRGPLGARSRPPGGGGDRPRGLRRAPGAGPGDGARPRARRPRPRARDHALHGDDARGQRAGPAAARAADRRAGEPGVRRGPPGGGRAAARTHTHARAAPARRRV
ncbi:MAG: hypothetical protein AVDCRST_MAG13-1178, partial [uncultured Solirubrobacteraceae bacterium]